MSELSVRRLFCARPAYRPSGTGIFAVPFAEIERRDERAVVYHYICQRQLFGYMYAALQRDYFDQMPQNSGVFVGAMIPTPLLVPDAVRPGDIDLLLIPYEGNELILHRTLAIEVKVIRARFDRQGKSPNDFGFSQTMALRELGFPYVGLLHIIVSDDSPTRAWRKAAVTQVIDAEGGTEELKDVWADMMPSDLMLRGFGRLAANSPHPDVGYVVSYLPFPSSKYSGIHMPIGHTTRLNSGVRIETLESVGRFFDRYFRGFVDTPRYRVACGATTLFSSGPVS